MVLNFDISRVAVTCEGGTLALRIEDDEAQRILRKYVQTAPYASKKCSTVEETADRFGFSEKKIRAWMEDGCPFYRVGTDIRLDDKEVDHWFSERFGRNRKSG